MRGNSLPLKLWVCAGLAVLLVGAVVRAQQPPIKRLSGQSLEQPVPDQETANRLPSGQGPAVPRLVKFSGVVKDAGSGPRSGLTGVTFALYKEQEGGAPLWLETQNVNLDRQGRYTVLLGSSQVEGLPLELFTAGEARWLGVQVEGGEEQARVLLVSVPYALKAADAETLGGKPLSDFVLANPQGNVGAAGSSGGEPGKASPTVTPSTTSPVATGGGTAGKIPKWADATTLTNSVIVETVSGNIGIGTNPGSDKLRVPGTFRVVGDNQFFGLTNTAFTNSFYFNYGTDKNADIANNFAGGAIFIRPGSLTRDAGVTFASTGKVGIGTAAPAYKLDVAGNLRVTTGGSFLTQGNYCCGVYAESSQDSTSAVFARALTSGGIAGLFQARPDGKILSLNNLPDNPILSEEVVSVSGSGDMRVKGLVNLGSQTGTGEAPNLPGLVVRRINSTDTTSGQVLARTDTVRLVRDGTTAGMLVEWDANPGYISVNCMGLSYTNAALNFNLTLSGPGTGGSNAIFTNAQRFVYAQCSFGDAYHQDNLTQVTLQRFDSSVISDSYIVGTVTSTYNQ